MNDADGKQPNWSAYREGSFGVGGLSIMDGEEAYFEWKRTACSRDEDKSEKPEFDSTTKGFKVDLNPACEVQKAPKESYWPQNNVGSDSVWMKSKKYLGCSLKPQNNKEKAPALGSGGTSGTGAAKGAPAAPGTPVPTPKNKDGLIIALSVLTALFGFGCVIISIYHILKMSKPTPPNLPHSYGKTEHALNRVE
jgi:hypothetical protein